MKNQQDLWSIRVTNGKPVGQSELLWNFGDAGVALRGFASDGALYYHRGFVQRDVYLADLNPATGKAVSEAKRLDERLTGNNGGPLRWSPDGQSLAYIRDGAKGSGIVIESIRSGEERDVPGVHSACLGWSPDGVSLMLQESDNGASRSLPRIDPKTGQIQVTAEIPGEAAGRLALSRDGKMLVYTKIEDAPGVPSLTRIMRHNFGGGPDKELYQTRETITPIVLSPDDSQIAFTTRTSLVTVRTDGGGPHVVRSGQELFCPDNLVAWTQGGRNVLAMATQSLKPETAVLRSFPVSGTDPVIAGLPSLACQSGFAVSPDGLRIAYVGERNQQEFWVLKSPLSNAKPSR